MKTLDPSLANLLAETLAASMLADQMQLMGEILDSKINIRCMSKKAANVTIAPRVAAQCMIAYFSSKNKLEDLIKLLAEMDEEILNGKAISIKGMEYFLQKLTETGFYFDFDKRKIMPVGKAGISEKKNWGSLKDGRNYKVTVMSIDIVGSSEMVKTHGREVMEKFYAFYWGCLKERLSLYNGRIWSWAGDGGIIAFAFKKHEENAIQFALEIQRVMPLINAHPRNLLKEEDVSIRLGIHTGKVGFKNDTGKIISDAINLAAHIEKKTAKPGCVAMSDEVYQNINPTLQRYFAVVKTKFEGYQLYKTPSRIDTIKGQRE